MKRGSLAFGIEFSVFDRSRHDSAKMSRQQVEQFADDQSELQELKELLDGLDVGRECHHPTQGLIITRIS